MKILNIGRNSLFLFILMSAFFVSAEQQTGISVNTAVENALQYLNENRAQLSITNKDISDAKIRDSYQSKNNGVSHLFFRQYLQGIEVHNGDIQINMDRNGSIINLHNQFLPDLVGKANTTTPRITAERAISLAAQSVGINSTSSIKLVKKFDTDNQKASYSQAGVSLEDIPVKLVYDINDSGLPRLAWDLQIQRSDAWWNIRVDAVEGDILSSDNWMIQDSYGVIPVPYESIESPNAVHEIVTNVANLVASPFGWHDTNGSAGAEFTDTRGNNVSAQEDLDANNSGGFRPDGGVSLTFDFTFNPALQPDEGTNLEAGIVNLFYWNNILHDIMYQYGFDEQAGNFQVNNYGNPGASGDSVNADAQDGSGNNNANFSTPPDGSSPRMQMFRYLAPPALTVNSPVSVAGVYSVGGASFGATLNSTGVTGQVEEANDGTATTSDACEALVGFTAGRIALIDRGDCEFGIKVLNAEQAGAIAAIVVNNQGDGLTTMAPGVNGGSVTIPSIFLGQSDGATIRAELGNNVNATLSKVAKDRDGDFDNGIVTHEYGHGISNRLTGGPATSSCLGNMEQMGEGWSDFFSLVLNAQAGDVSNDIRTHAAYASNLPLGNRQFPYTTNMAINTHTFDDIDQVAVPHGVGSVWAAILWEVYWNLVDEHGFNADLYQGTGGNNIMLQLVIDGLKMQPCNPSFEQGRDAILTADQVNNSGANQCFIWKGFAKRGLGFSASSGDGNILGDETVAFDIPNVCLEDLIFDNGFE